MSKHLVHGEHVHIVIAIVAGYSLLMSSLIYIWSVLNACGGHCYTI